MSLQYIIGARQSGKTTRLKELIQDNTLIVIVSRSMWVQFRPTIAQPTNFKMVVPADFVWGNMDSMRLGDYARVLVDNADMMPDWFIDQLIAASHNAEITITFTPFVVTLPRVPALWEHWGKATIERLQNRDFAFTQLLKDEMPEDHYRSQILGEWVIKE